MLPPINVSIDPSVIQIIDRTNLTPRHVVKIDIDTGELPPHRMQQYFSAIKEKIGNTFEPAHVIYTSKGSVEIIIEEEGFHVEA